MPGKLNSIEKAQQALILAWPSIKEECLSVLGSELHYQAMVYHCLRSYGEVPASQLGMNVKMWIDNPTTKLFKKLDKRKHEDYQGGYEPIPDVVIFRPGIKSDWRRRNRDKTLIKMLITIEVKASERSESRLRPGEIIKDLEKLAAHKKEVKKRGSNIFPVMMVVDSAPLEAERMTSYSIETFVNRANQLKVGVLYCSPTTEINTIE